MQLRIEEPTDLSNDSLAKEIATALLTLECGYEAVSTGDYESVSAQRILDKTQSILTNPDRYPIFADFLTWRDYGLTGKYKPDIPSPHDAYALLLMSAPGVELFGTNHAFDCSVILQAMVARGKIDTALDRPVPQYIEDEMFLEFSIGGKHSGLTVYELSLLAGMSVQSVRNEFQKTGSPALEKEESGMVTLDAKSAHAWLMGRRGYHDTYILDASDETILVPQARDGSYFNPTCKQRSGYKIGRKGQEKEIENFLDALQALAAMPKAYWRRPSPTSGVPGIVSAVTWVAKSKKELSIN